MSSANPKSSRTLINIICLVAVMIILCVFQSVVWFQLFHPVPQPNLWLPVVVYLSLYRPLKIGISGLYLAGIFLATMTSQPLYLLLINLLCIYFGLQMLRLKFFWPGTGYFVMVCTASMILWPIVSWILSLNFESNFLRYPRYGSWLLQLIFMPIFAPLVFGLLRQIDNWTNYQIPNEYGFDSL